MQQFENSGDAEVLALAIVEAIPDPLVVMNSDFRIVAANRCFSEAFHLDPKESHNQVLFNLGNGVWEIPALRTLLAKAFSTRVAVDGFELEGDFGLSGPRTIILNVRLVEFAGQAEPMILLGLKDITDRREIERKNAELLASTSERLAQQHILVREIQHRVANSLQIIASILMLKMRAVTSPEAREHLQDAHERVLSVAKVQSHLSSAEGVDRIDIAGYLSKLCQSLASSMIPPDTPITVSFTSQFQGTVDSTRAVSLGLIVTEMVLNAIKHAFPDPAVRGSIIVSYEASGDEWALAIRDDGIGTGKSPSAGSGGLGTAIVTALASQLSAVVTTTSGDEGRSIVVGPSSREAPLSIAA